MLHFNLAVRSSGLSNQHRDDHDCFLTCIFSQNVFDSVSLRFILSLCIDEFRASRAVILEQKDVSEEKYVSGFSVCGRAQ